MKVFGEKYNRARKIPKTVKIEGVPGIRAPNDVGCLEGTWDGILRNSTTLMDIRTTFTTVSSHSVAAPQNHKWVVWGHSGEIQMVKFLSNRTNMSSPSPFMRA